MSGSRILVEIWSTPDEPDCWEASARRDGKEGWGCEPTPHEAASSAVTMLLTDPSHLGSSKLDRYKIAFLELMLDRRVRGPLPDKEEARRADEHARLWERLDPDEQGELEAWIEAKKQTLR